MCTPPTEGQSLSQNISSTRAVSCKRRSCSWSRSAHFLRLLLPVVMIICTTYILQWRKDHSSLDTRWIGDSIHRDPLHRRQLKQLFPFPSGPVSPVSPTPSSTTPSPSSASPKKTLVSDQLVPTVPNGPPILPTPFPQAFDGGVAQNFSTLSCASFFSNMTSAAPFRTCRPFSLLLGTSAAFINVRSFFYYVILTDALFLWNRLKRILPC